MPRFTLTRLAAMTLLLMFSMSISTLAQEMEDLPPGQPLPGKKPAKSATSGNPRPSTSANPAAASSVKNVGEWERAAGLIARNYAPFAGEFYANIKWDSRHPSSAGLTVEEALNKHQYTMMAERSIGLPMPMRIDIPRAEAEAVAMALPDVAPNEFGYILSANIKEILGPDEMWLDQVWLIDADEYQRIKQREERELRGQESAGRTTSENIRKQFEFRDRLVQKQEGASFQRGFVLKGVPTGGLATKTRWSGDQRRQAGLQVVFVGSRLQDVSGMARRKDRLLVAVPGDRFRPGLNETQVREMLRKRNLTPEQLVQMFEEERHGDLRSVEVAVIRRLEAAREAIETKAAEEAKQQEKQQRSQRKPATGSGNKNKPRDAGMGD